MRRADPSPNRQAALRRPASQAAGGRQSIKISQEGGSRLKQGSPSASSEQPHCGARKLGHRLVEPGRYRSGTWHKIFHNMSYANHPSPQKRARDPPLSLLHKAGKSRFWTAFRIHWNAVLAHLAQDRAEAIKVVSFDHRVAFFDQSVVLPFVDRQRSFICQVKEHVDKEAGLLQNLVKKSPKGF